ncbi:ribonuclease P protein component [Enterobacteriaceae endosymbiont of Macroplea mutica]|uniref:ribonuclease P protein component n=1 Tax=Enterobacteriaceae endosymbiont of Macroplea mutica TaxID=2675791 RepID=UPI001449AE43|nr:ribonuclease P protein component [Enterobacteriaceae endosymbiont of Macroplea mutica]QJC31429.1 ribonuclease P protein component [Enterobacteriaceae endosymbiont of Macroplea mutica]
MLHFAFKKKQRLYTNKHYCHIFKHHTKYSNKYYLLLVQQNIFKYSRLGIIISKKNIVYAHMRNKHKRIIREYFRLHQHIITIMDYIMIIHNRNIIHVKQKTLQNYLNILLEKNT